MSALESRLLALDWGTTSLRVHRLGDGGVAIETRQLPLGIANIARAAAGRDAGATRDASGDPTGDANAAFERAFDEACGDWVRASPGTPVIACGMVGSAQGWREVPYLDVPAGADRIAPALTALASASGATLHLVPGLIERGRLPNVMRGEETQVVGALDEMAAGATAARTLVILPGTHSKWAHVRGHEIIHFDTFMTGEVYDVLATHTLLARTLRRPPQAPPAAEPNGLPAGPPQGPVWDVAAFDRGVDVARSPEGRAGALSTIFSTRALAVTGELSGEAQADYLSGLLIGHEVRGMHERDPQALDGASRILLAGSEPLCRRYERVLATFGHSGIGVARHATERGLWCLARAAGLVDAAPARAPVDGPARDRVGAGSAATARGSLRRALARCGLLAILRGVRPDEAAAIGGALYAAGFRAIEVPLNSADPLASIRTLRQSLASDCAIGAGTVMSAAEVDQVRRAGADFVVMPHTDASVIRAAVAADLDVAPGVATMAEAFASLAAGADVLKLFPADEMGAGALAAWRAVLPGGAAVIAVGGITPASLAAFAAAGAAGFGLGSALYRPGLTADEVAARASAFMAAWRAAIPPPAATSVRPVDS